MKRRKTTIDVLLLLLLYNHHHSLIIIIIISHLVGEQREREKETFNFVKFLSSHSSSSVTHTESRDLSLALRSGEWPEERLAPRSQYPRQGAMGRSVRDAERRYTEWERDGEVIATELYEARPGVNEERNLARDKPQELTQMRALLRARFKL